jgi:ATP-dependent RNA helicase HelY
VIGPTGTTRPFSLDRFQLEAMRSIDEGRSVVVAAPTGSGKTVVAEHAVRDARAHRQKLFYTTPIKALSNQKFHDLAREHGPEHVGLLTGDNAIRADAPVVVMTTEVLRNMLYAGSPLLADLRWVVLDEVHYLEDPYRGPVWEEVVIHLPRSTGLVCLSATVSNADELAGWIDTVHGATDLVTETRRPVPLEHEYVVGEKHRTHLHVVPVLHAGRPNRDGSDYDIGGGGRRRAGNDRRRWVTPRRAEVVHELQRRHLLPAIYFIFSRAGCDDAATALAGLRLELTTPAERRRIGAILDEHLAGLGPEEHEALDARSWREMVLGGVAAHHAGMVPPFKEAVERCFVEGLVKVVFATETLALGINMPARSVVIERLTKFTGEQHEVLTPGQYTQLTGRAGRRGIDHEGHAWVLWSPWVRFDEIATLAGSRSFELRSAFRPTYNMAANLVRRHGRDEALTLLRSSFGQYQASRDLARLAGEVSERRQAIAHLEARLVDRLPAGDDWRDLLGPGPGAADRAEIEAAVRALRPGTVARLGETLGVVLSVAQRGPFTRLTYADGRGRRQALHSTVLDAVPEVLGQVDLPQPYAPNDPGYASETARLLRNLVGDEAARDTAGARARSRRRALVRKAKQLQRAIDDADRVEQRLDQGAESLVREFDRVLGVLRDWGYVEGWDLTERGELLAGLYHECDLLVAEALSRGVLDGLDGPDLAGVLSAVVYEHRGADGPPEPWYPTRRLRERSAGLALIAAELAVVEDRHQVRPTRPPDPTFLPIAQAWAAGGSLEDVLHEEPLSGGDFVRVVKQLIDLLGQVARVAPEGATRRAALQAGDGLRRGIVAVSSMVTGPDADEPDDGDAGHPGSGTGQP